MMHIRVTKLKQGLSFARWPDAIISKETIKKHLGRIGALKCTGIEGLGD